MNTLRTLTLLSTLGALACGKNQETGSPTGGPDSAADSSSDTSQYSPDACEVLGMTRRDFTDAEDDDSLYAVAADFTVPTRRTGDWSFSANWSGCETYLFIQDDPNQVWIGSEGLWDRDVDELFEKLPLNVHLFFVSTATSTTSIDESLDVIEDAIDDVLDTYPEDERSWWWDRVHLVTTRAQAMDGWLGQIMSYPGWGVGIDRFQRIRYIGSYADPTRYSSSYGWFEDNISMVANEAIYYNYESDRQDEMDSQDALVTTVFDGDRVAGEVYAEVELPDSATLGAYDSVAVDCYMGCEGDGEYGDCPAWDYMAYLFMCSEATEENPYADTPCQPAVDEIVGECMVDGKPTGQECSTEDDCAKLPGANKVCVGYQAAVEADTMPGQCLDPTGKPEDASYICNSKGTGYSDLECACGTEIGRWITTYHREGRWLHDISPMLPLLASGGTRRFRFETNGPYELELALRFFDAGKDARPAETSFLFAGGTIDSDYNAGYEPITFDVPSDVTKVELATVITGHGADSNNCAEFCDIAHHFTINGDQSADIVLDFPEASTMYDCMDKVAEGTVPNQYGTWWYGRAGWCPGKQVNTVTTDITQQVSVGADNTIEYRALYDDQDYTGSATIYMASWLVFSR